MPENRLKIFIINLADRADRRAHVHRQLAASGTDFEFFTAVEGPGALRDYFAGRNDWPSHMQLERRGSPSEIACYASHLSVWRKCIELNEPVIILEDDFAVTDDFLPVLDFTSRHIRKYGFIRLEPTERQWQLTPYSKPLPVLREGRFTLCFQTSVSPRATAYALTPSTAKRFCDVSSIYSLPVDHMLTSNWIHKLPLFVVDPPAIALSELAFKSSIAGRKKSPLRHFLRQIKLGYRAWARYATARTNKYLSSEYAHLITDISEPLP